MKEKWFAPKTVIEEFTPNEYVAACWGVACDWSAANDYEKSIGIYDETHLCHAANQCGQQKNQRLYDTDGDGKIDIMKETGTDGLGNLECIIYRDEYITQISPDQVNPGDFIYWTTSSGYKTWHHRGTVSKTANAS